MAAGKKASGGRRAGSARPASHPPGDGRQRAVTSPMAAARRRREEPPHAPSPTAIAAEALRTGVVPLAIRRPRGDQAIPGEAERIRVGDPDDEPLQNEYVGEETPGGSTPTPDQSNVDDIGRAYGVQEEDSGELRTSREVMEGRDHRRRGFSAKHRPD
jgi:hypothetical protein